MMAVILFILFAAAFLGLVYVAYVHVSLKSEFKDKEWMDNSEYDYGHNVNYTDKQSF